MKQLTKIIISFVIMALLSSITVVSAGDGGRAGTNMKTERKQQKVDERSRVKALIRQQMKDTLARIQALSKKQQKKEYDKILRSADAKIESGTLTEKEKLILKVLKEIIREEKQKIQ